jgi:hypothetical protein
VIVLDEPDPMRYAVRWAAAEVIAEAERKAQQRK